MADRSIKEIQAELRATELGEGLRAAKETDEGPSVELKEALRDARREWRTLRAERTYPADTVRPDTIAATSTVESPGA